MARKVRVRVQVGRLEPMESIDLPEGKEVIVTIEEPAEKTAAEAFERAAGAWKGKVDTDALIKMLYEARLRPGGAPAILTICLLVDFPSICPRSD